MKHHLAAIAALTFSAASAMAEPIPEAQAEFERQQCLQGAVRSMGSPAAIRYCGCLKEEILQNYSLQLWLTMNAEAERIIKAGGSGDDIGRQIPEFRQLARTCRARAGL